MSHTVNHFSRAGGGAPVAPVDMLGQAATDFLSRSFWSPKMPAGSSLSFNFGDLKGYVQSFSKHPMLQASLQLPSWLPGSSTKPPLNQKVVYKQELVHCSSFPDLVSIMSCHWLQGSTSTTRTARFAPSARTNRSLGVCTWLGPQKSADRHALLTLSCTWLYVLFKGPTLPCCVKNGH